MPALEKLLICSLSLFGGYFLYKRNQSSYKFFFFIDSFLYGIIFASCLLLFNSLIEPYINLSFRYIGFFQAALPEKLCAYIYLYIFIKKKDIRDIPALINVAIFFASGFAFLENIIYAYAISSSVIFMRLFSSVIVHIATCSLIAYFMGQYHLHSFKAERILYLLLAFFIPFFFHAAYDTLLISGGNSTYLIALELAGLIVLIEYTIAHSHYFPSRDELLQKKIFFDDWKILQKQPQYERWILKSMKKRNEDFTPLFRFHMSHARWLLFLITLFTSISAATFQNEVTSSLGLHLSREELITLLILYPALVCLQLFLNGSINPEYFRYSRISIPVMSEVQFLYPKLKTHVLSTDINPLNSFFITFEPLPIQEEITFRCVYSERISPPIRAKITWQNHEDISLPFGTLVHIQKPDLKIIRFLFRYALFKLRKGLIFNLKIPGFENIRKFFVKTSTVMESLEYIEKGTVLFNEGESGETFYLLKKGEIEIFKTLESGEKVIMARVKPGEIFGEMAILGNQPRAAGAICKEDSVLAVASRNNLEGLLQGNPDFAYKLMQTLASRIRNSEKILSSKIEELELKTLKYDFLKNEEVKLKDKLFQLLSSFSSDFLLLDKEGRILHKSTSFIESYPQVPEKAERFEEIYTLFYKKDLRAELWKDLKKQKLLRLPLKSRNKSAKYLHLRLETFESMDITFFLLHLEKNNL